MTEHEAKLFMRRIARLSVTQQIEAVAAEVRIENQILFLRPVKKWVADNTTAIIEWGRERKKCK